VFRCNVDYGDPHVQSYCAVVVDGSVQAAEWREVAHGRQNRTGLQEQCAQRLSDRLD
jgi:hypothetical protein